MRQAISLIKLASSHDGCSTGEYHLAQFVKSCLNYKDTVNIKEVVYRADINQIKEVMDLAQSDALRILVEQVNPGLLE